jgi:hypothetical protein
MAIIELILWRRSGSKSSSSRIPQANRDAHCSTLVSRRDVHKIVKIDLAPPDIMEAKGGDHNRLLPFLVLQ